MKEGRRGKNLYLFDFSISPITIFHTFNVVIKVAVFVVAVFAVAVFVVAVVVK